MDKSGFCGHMHYSNVTYEMLNQSKKHENKKFAYWKAESIHIHCRLYIQQARRNVFVSGGYKFVWTLYNLVVSRLLKNFDISRIFDFGGTGDTSPELGGHNVPPCPHSSDATDIQSVKHHTHSLCWFPSETENNGKTTTETRHHAILQWTVLNLYPPQFYYLCFFCYFSHWSQSLEFSSSAREPFTLSGTSFQQIKWPSCHPTDSVKALKEHL